jgi:hypothetical protein
VFPVKYRAEPADDEGFWKMKTAAKAPEHPPQLVAISNF